MSSFIMTVETKCNQNILIKLILVLLVICGVSQGKSPMVVISLRIDVLNGHERDSFRKIVHLLICGFGKRNVGFMEPSEIMLVDNLPRIQKEG
jgi:hypothetical protein